MWGHSGVPAALLLQAVSACPAFFPNFISPTLLTLSS
jgi:hypothetical protein